MNLTLACPVSETFPFTIKSELVEGKMVGLVDESGGEDWTEDGLVPELAGGCCADDDMLDDGDNADGSSLHFSLMWGFRFLDGDFGELMLTGSGKRDSELLLLDAGSSLTPFDNTFL